MPFENGRELIISGRLLSQRRHQEFVVHVWWEDGSGSIAATRPEVIDIWDPTTSLTSLSRYNEVQMDPRYVMPWIPRRRNILNYLILNRLRYFLDKVGPASRQSCYIFPQPEIWVDNSGSIVLMGEAAHPRGVSVLSVLPLTSPKLLILSRFIILSSNYTLAWYSVWPRPRSRGCRHTRHAVLARAERGSGFNAFVRLSGPAQGSYGYVDRNRAAKLRTVVHRSNADP